MAGKKRRPYKQLSFNPNPPGYVGGKVSWDQIKASKSFSAPISEFPEDVAALVSALNDCQPFLGIYAHAEITEDFVEMHVGSEDSPTTKVVKYDSKELIVEAGSEGVYSISKDEGSEWQIKALL